MASVEDISRLAFQNLLLLGLDVDELNSKHGITINVNTLIGPIASQKAMEMVLHFVMLKLFPSEAGQAFKLLWPIVDKSQQRDFRKFVTEKLVQLQRDRELPPTPPIRGTVIENPVGPKFCQLLLQISQLVMKRQLRMFRPHICTQLPLFKRTCSASLIRLCQMHLTRERDLFLKSVADMLYFQEEWKRSAEKLISLFDEAHREQAEFRVKYDSLIAQFGTDFLTEKSMSERQNMAARFTEGYWHELRNFFGAHEDINMVETILFSNSDRPRIALTNEFAEMSTSQFDQIDLASLLKRWAACISQLQRNLTKNSAFRLSLERLAEKEPDLNRLVTRVAEQGKTITTFHGQLDSLLDELEKSIDLLQIEIRQIRSESLSRSCALSDHRLQVGTGQSTVADDVELDMIELERLLCTHGDISWPAKARDDWHEISCQDDSSSTELAEQWLSNSKMDERVANINRSVENHVLQCNFLRKEDTGPFEKHCNIEPVHATSDELQDITLHRTKHVVRS